MNMITVNRIGDSISGSANMKTFGIKYSEAKYEEMKRLEQEANEAVSMEALKAIVEQFELLTKEDYKGTVETVCPDLYVDEEKGHFYLKLKNGVISKRAIPQPLVERILKSVDLKIDPQPIIKACIRFMRNPNFSDEKFARFANYINYQSVDGPFRDQLIKEEGVSVEVATQRATVYQVPITMEGLICTYKVSAELLDKFDKETGKKIARYPGSFDEDSGASIPGEKSEYVEDRVFYPASQGLTGGDAFTCAPLGEDGKKGHLIRVGARHFLDNWNQVNTNDWDSCVKGLHCGNLDYIQGYQGTTHNTFIDPMHIGAITNDGSGALRVLEYYTYSSFAGQNRGIYHSSTYAAHTDTQWEAMKEEAIANSEAKQAKHSGKIEQLSAL